MKNKGFTMVELLVSLGISSIVAGLIMTLFISNYKGYKLVRNDTELQFQAQYILSFMADKIINSNSISFIRKDNTVYYNLTTNRNAGEDYPLKKISFSYGSGGINENHVFNIKENNIRYGILNKDGEPTGELGNYVDSMYIFLLKNSSFQDAKAVKIKIIMKKDGQTYEAFQVAYMRNN